MRPSRCTIDTSCVIALDLVDLLPKLSFLFSAVLIPRAVRSELFRRRRTRDRIQALLRDYSFLQPCDEYDRGAADVLLVERARQGVADRGETEAVVQAAAVGSAVVVDDHGAERWPGGSALIATAASGSCAGYFNLASFQVRKSDRAVAGSSIAAFACPPRESPDSLRTPAKPLGLIPVDPTRMVPAVPAVCTSGRVNHEPRQSTSPKAAFQRDPSDHLSVVNAPAWRAQTSAWTASDTPTAHT